MNNKEQSWRLEDEEGKQLGKPPVKKMGLLDGDVQMFFEGRYMGSFQSVAVESMTIEHPTPYVRMDNRPDYTESNIERLIFEEVTQYHYSYGIEPKYIILNRDAYHSLMRAMMAHRFRSRTNNEDTYMGIELICNPSQERAITVIGEPRREAYEGGMYRV